MSENISLRVLRIVPGTSVDGPGLRTSIYFAGCRHHCKGCHNPESWDLEGGELMSLKEIMNRIKEEGFNVTFSGGDPIVQVGPLTELAKLIRQEGFNIWLYTGYTIEQLLQMPEAADLLTYVNTIVDGQFVQEKRDISLCFRGSSNQRIINLR
ncbi:MAG: anaerobic ribonucleoside-triphosphate reductase activating protein [Muribaculaceae bacterium]|nr:anaerobic ribonucleoside-triphosphate reductase activating protein [Muribaculaceae bacterium]MDE7393950.1 anaerobic ribonucleoside-triphosphate reductase activating protein [Muribaculaceae bacterium]